MKKFLHRCFFLSVVTLFISCSQNNDIVTINWWQFPTFGEDGIFEQRLISAFEEKHPNINVELKMISFENGPALIETALATKTAPDITYDSPGRIIDWGNRGLLEPLNSLIEPVTSHLAEAPLAASRGKDGNYYMYPVHTGGFTMAFNKNLLEDLGLLEILPYNRGDRSWTLQEYEALLKALHAKLPSGKVPAVFYAKSSAGDQGTRAFMANLHGDAPLMDSQLTEYIYNSTNAVKNVEWLQTAVKEGLILNGLSLQSADAINMYCASNAASTILFSLQLEKINQNKINYNGEYFESIYMPFPNNSGKPQLEFIVGGPTIFNNGDKKKIAAAKKFIEFLAQDKTYAPILIEETGLFPVSKDIAIIHETEEEKWNAEASQFFGLYYNSISNFSQMRPLWLDTMQDALQGEDAQKILNRFVKNANNTLK